MLPVLFAPNNLEITNLGFLALRSKTSPRVLEQVRPCLLCFLSSDLYFFPVSSCLSLSLSPLSLLLPTYNDTPRDEK